MHKYSVVNYFNKFINKLKSWHRKMEQIEKWNKYKNKTITPRYIHN